DSNSLVCTDAGLTQTPNLILATGQTAHLRCEQTDEHYIMYWYWLQQRKGLQLIYSSVINSVQDNRFSMVRDNDRHCTLQIDLLKTRDSALYFCATSHTLLQNLEADRQKLDLGLKIYYLGWL
uniref:Ig-like domain-containing protein n=1 Tax=Chrysemys picta bellii TaxID=8478 RepID=A0A8C3HG02_CHRPI